MTVCSGTKAAPTAGHQRRARGEVHGTGLGESSFLSGRQARGRKPGSTSSRIPLSFPQEQETFHLGEVSRLMKRCMNATPDRVR
jgi:hypothetical protein